MLDMSLSERPQSHLIDFCCKDESSSSPPTPPPSSHMILQLPNHNPNSTLFTPSTDDSDLLKAPKKRAETWVQDETRSLISLRREMDSLFNTSKSNKHLWEKISLKMREKGFDRSPTMCTDKWRNLLKEFKKAKYQERERGLVRDGGGGTNSSSNNTNSSKMMSCYKEIEQILRERSSNGQFRGSDSTNTSTANANVNLKVDDAYVHFSDKGIEDPGISFGPADGSSRPALNLEGQLDHDGHPLAITVTDADAANGVPPWSWRETSGHGVASQSYGERVISVKWGDYTRRIGIDGTADTIKEAIRSAFRLRTKRAFWLEDEDQIVRSLDKDMPLGNYTLHLDEGLAIKVVCLYDETDQIPVHTEDKVFYTEDDYHEFLTRRRWISLREFDGFRNVDNMDDLQPGAFYRGVS